MGYAGSIRKWRGWWWRLLFKCDFFTRNGFSDIQNQYAEISSKNATMLIALAGPAPA
jgi:hypothetical protein